MPISPASVQALNSRALLQAAGALTTSCSATALVISGGCTTDCLSPASKGSVTTPFAGGSPEMKPLSPQCSVTVPLTPSQM